MCKHLKNDSESLPELYYENTIMTKNCAVCLTTQKLEADA